MSVASEGKTTVALGGFGELGPAVRRDSRENSPRRLVPHTWLLTARLLRRWRRDPATVLQSLMMPVALLVTLNIVFEDGISKVTGHSALYGSVPLIAMVGAMSGSMVGGIGLMRERRRSGLSGRRRLGGRSLRSRRSTTVITRASVVSGSSRGAVSRAFLARVVVNSRLR